jgi:type I restriction enzyme M protein
MAAVHFRAPLSALSLPAGEIFKKARPDIQNPATLPRLIVDLIEPVKWFSMQAAVKGDIYEGLLARDGSKAVCVGLIG